MTHPDRNPDPIAALMREAATLDARDAAEARAAFLDKVDEQLPHRKKRRMPWVAPLALAAAVALAWLVWPQGSLSYDVAGADDDGGYIRTPPGARATVRFTDATEVRAEPGARLRVVETHPDGARVSVEEGTLDVHVTHTESSAWNFVAGPFDVHVTGTRFDLEWNPKTESLRVDLHEGSVEIAGHEGSGPMAVRAGQRFVGNARKRTMQVSPLTTAPDERVTTTDAADEGALSPDETSEAKGIVEKEGTLPSDPADERVIQKAGQAQAPSWSALVSKGKFADVVTAAHERGVASCLSSCGAADLGALADAARYTGQNPLAEKALGALRSRFSSSSGPRAAFLLGRLEEGQGRIAQAKLWYETSLRESPSGAYAGEALAGKMRAVLSLEGRAAARPIARQYLKRYPEGVHAAAAQKIALP